MIRRLSIALLLASAGPAWGATNTLTIREIAGATTVNYPIQLGRPFALGEIAQSPEAVLNGTPVPTQADVKSRWPDGSVKHAILTFYIPTLTAGASITVTFQNQPNGTDPGLSQAQMLDAAYNFDAVFQLTNGTTRTVSGRTMLSSGSFTYWLRGPNATSIVLADHGAARTYDVGFDSYRAFRPIVHATFWPAIHKVRVRFIGEIANTEALEDQIYALALRIGSTAPATVYSKPTFTHYGATRWTKEFWIGGAPPAIAIDHNLAYLASTNFVPNFDTRKVISETALASAYAGWQAQAKDLYGAGGWDQVMGNTGGRPDIGPYPTWTVRWLYTGDPRMREQAFGNADLAAAWPVHYREGDATKNFTRDGAYAGLGRVISVTDRRTIYLSDLLYTYTAAGDAVIPVGSLTNGGWSPDGAHQPDPVSPQYILTGDFWYLEEMYFWASWSTAKSNGAAYAYSYGRGPTGAEGGIPDQIRGQAWVLRGRTQTAFLAPDGSPEKAYFTTLINDAIATWEGARNITGTSFQGSASWNWGRSNQTPTLGVPPLHQWEEGSAAFVSSPLNPLVTKEAISTWEQGFMMYSLGRARELGYPTGALVSWLAVQINGQATSPDYDPYLTTAYRLPTARMSDGRYFDTWAGMKSAYLASYFDPNNPQNVVADFRENNTRVEHGYSLIAMAATSMSASEPGGSAAWAFFERETLPTPQLNDNPKWVILPRSIPGGPSGDLIPPAAPTNLQAR